MTQERVGGTRRKHRRWRHGGIAATVSSGVAYGNYRVENVSAGGALLSEGAIVPVGDEVEVLLRFGSHIVNRLAAHVVRHEHLGARGTALAVVFAIDDPDTEDAVQQYALEEIERRAAPRVLVVSRSPRARAELVRLIERTGAATAAAGSPLEAIAHVADPRASVTAAIVDHDLGTASGLELLHILADLAPSVRRVLVSRAPRPANLTLARTLGAAQAMLTWPTTSGMVAAAVGLDANAAPQLRPMR